MTQFHAAIAYLTAAIGLVMLAMSIVAVAWPERTRTLLDRAILVSVGVIAVGVISGLPLLVGGPGPQDVLHFGYAVGALMVLGIARYLGRTGSLRARAVIMLVGSVTLLGFVYRLFTTA